MNLQAIFKSLSQLTDIPESEWDYLKSKNKWHSVEKGNLLIRAGDVSDRIYYCQSGVFRMFYLKEDGDEFNKSFVSEEQFFTSYSSVIRSIPSYFAIQARRMLWWLPLPIRCCYTYMNVTIVGKWWAGN
ncbi:Crp/Fnr family transcriptional regulator [Gracilibacillus massiliensis]|uniref:Crp/Fnr family transcriptional regulator n=1 Tax=Gracilibacillus massiliensis TaxID=1564956 RepID=UPI00071E448D|nr:cyclic nucleotide-binding domain-containing protein [Gracilibacillus massiliensis]